MLISFVIPFYNEEGNLHEFLLLLKNSINLHQEYEFEVILINDCSTDNGRKVVLDFIADDNMFRLVEQSHNSGQTACFRKGFGLAKGEYIFRIDSDMQDDPRDLKYFLDKIDTKPDIIMGIREDRQHNRFLRAAHAIYDVIVILLINSPFKDSGSFVAFKAKHVRNLNLVHNDHRYLPLIVFYKGGKNIKELVVSHKQRGYGVSKYTTFNKIITGLPELIFFLIRLKTNFYSKIK